MRLVVQPERAWNDTRTCCQAFWDKPTCRPDPTMTSSAALVESLRAPSDFLGRFTPLPAALAGDLAGDMEAACAAAGSPLRAAPLAADLTVLGFFAGFSFSESEPRFVPAPARAPESHNAGDQSIGYQKSGRASCVYSGDRLCAAGYNHLQPSTNAPPERVTLIMRAPLSPSAAVSHAVASAQLENSDPAHPAHRHHQRQPRLDDGECAHICYVLFVSCSVTKAASMRVSDGEVHRRGQIGASDAMPNSSGSS